MDEKDATTGNAPGEPTLRVRKACEFCRRRRIKCQLNPGAASCNACLSRNQPCILETLPPKSDTSELGDGDINALGPLALLRHSFLNGSVSSTQLSATVDKMSSELKVYKEMAKYYQTQMSRLTQGLAPTPSQTSPSLSFPPSIASSNPLSFQHPSSATSSLGANSSNSNDTQAKQAAESFRFSPDGSHLILPDGHTLSTHDLMARFQKEYLISLTVLFCGEYAIPLVGTTQSSQAKFVTLCQPLVFEDERAPEDCREESLGNGISRVMAPSDMPLDTILDLWEHTMVFVGGASSMSANSLSILSPSTSPSLPSFPSTSADPVTSPRQTLSSSPALLNAFISILSKNCEILMRLAIFQRGAHTKERYAARLVRLLIGMSVYYRQLHKIGAASSLLMIAHQVIATFPAVIPPVLSDRIYVLLLLGASTEHERSEWLHMLHDQIHFTAATLLSFNVGFIVSKLRTHPVMTPPVVEEITEKLTSLEVLLPTCTVEVPLFQVWVKILIACFHGELGARVGEMQRAAQAIVRIEQLVRDNYSNSLAVILLSELRNFAQHCSPCSVLINGQERVLCHYVIERVQAVHDELTNASIDATTISANSSTSASTPSPTNANSNPYPSEAVSVDAIRVDLEGALDPSQPIVSRPPNAQTPSLSSSSSKISSKPSAKPSTLPSSSSSGKTPITPASHFDLVYYYNSGNPHITTPSSQPGNPSTPQSAHFSLDPSSTGAIPPSEDAFSLPPTADRRQLEEEDALIGYWSSTGNRLNSELFGFSGSHDTAGGASFPPF